jgi:hypothetical protein
MIGTRIRGRGLLVVMTLTVTMATGIASASGDVDGDRAAARRIVLRDGDLISPSALTMSRNEVLEFENDSGQFMRLVFVEPEDQTDRIRCYPTDHAIARPRDMPWTLFEWAPGRRLSATIPPGKFASTCSLVPGQYAFVATRVSRDPRGADHSLGTKGTIRVQ